MSRLYNYFLTGYKAGKITAEQLDIAVSKDYITQEENETIKA